ncbi:MAG: serine/threonine-protein kinase [Planctomycetia bacterium]|nr:serine/threonine-protein kinase [Planctomycetia bacterium]
MNDSATARLAKDIVRNGLVTKAELQQALAAQGEAAGEAGAQSILKYLVDRGHMTSGQAQRVLDEAKEDTAAPAAIPGYEIMQRIGRGSQAIVFKARQVSMDRVVALKILSQKSAVAVDAESRQRFVQEARAAAQLNHNNIVQAYDAGEAGGYSYFVMEYVEGTTVADVIEMQGGALGEKQALKIILQIAEALEHSHSRGFIHRDVKPKNIMITNEGIAKLADMGLARRAEDIKLALDEVGKAFGTPYYIAPEQVRGDINIDFRADIYSLGATLYHMVTGRVPFQAPTPQAVMQKHLTATLVPPDHINSELSAGICEVIEVMMSRRPKDRYASTKDLLVDLRSVFSDEPPRLARELVDGAIPQGLADGEELDEREAAELRGEVLGNPMAFNTLAVILAIILALSLILNLILALA